MKKIAQVVFSLVVALPGLAYANHGPGTTGGSATTQSGDTLKEGQFTLSLDENYTNYEDVSQAEVEARGTRSGGFDSLRESFTTSATLGYGITSDLQLDASVGWYSGRGFTAAGESGEGSEAEKSRVGRVGRGQEGGHSDGFDRRGPGAVAVGNPKGATDLSLRAKYRLFKGPAGHFSVLAGGLLPTGKDNVRLDDGEQLDPSSQPGSGRYSALAGLAYSRYLTPRVTAAASSVYTYRVERDGFQIGDRLDTGLALVYRLSESVGPYPQASLFGEVSHQRIGKDVDGADKNPNSGGEIVYAVAGLRVGVTTATGVVLASSIPLVAYMNGDQIEPEFRIMSSVYAKF